jgi:diaminopimelate decarboxylase
VFSRELLRSFKNIQTPFYYYDLDLLRNTLKTLSKELDTKSFKVHYAIKANANNIILEIIKNHGLGIDAVSGNEIKKSLEIGYSNKDIVFAGVGKTDVDINYAINNEIACFNCESVEELEVINTLSLKLNKTSNVSLRLNPNIVSDTHKKITTGTEKNKFGIDINDLHNVLIKMNDLSNLKLSGIHFHLGSQIGNINVFKKLSQIANKTNKRIYEYGILLNHINVGGGLSIDYLNPQKNPLSNFKDYFNIYKENIKLMKNQKLYFELGRSLVGQSGFLISKVLFTKKSYKRNYIILDAGMSELMRPSLYNSYHKILNITSREMINKKYDVVGPLCESSDVFIKNLKLPTSKRGDLFCIYSSGAYGETMSSNYNLRNNIKSYFSDSI